ncbi:hypothetical protein H312_01610 [Anncaliia algerae PRA339]|uniref:Uncharacterized protein n=1 Tax=Anncaliia algerae PRA339 TaxID=1288291 RepID=A0A059F1B2_9MICR|nr:hypothetical protein H312_01610 [Anncaliia algerae PRA339]
MIIPFLYSLWILPIDVSVDPTVLLNLCAILDNITYKFINLPMSGKKLIVILTSFRETNKIFFIKYNICTPMPCLRSIVNMNFTNYKSKYYQPYLLIHRRFQIISFL